MKLIVVTSETFIEDEVAVIRLMLSSGLRAVHVRKPDFSIEEMRSFLNRFNNKERSCMVLHSCFSLAVELGLKGIHLCELDRLSINPAGLKEEFRVVSTAVHNEEALENLTRKFEYVFLSPVFDSISKPGYRSNFSFDSLRTTLAKTPIPVYALGGMTAERVAQVHELGFSGVAALGAIWNSPDRISRFKSLKNACDLLRYEHVGATQGGSTCQI